ncbi:efflux RND transporter periplasmic adaptor subunit [Aeromonas rivipollensis]|uniref:efflux RND transporter periplasmic adaptor subunit n=1 Tax=Aeromonas rivipollensis TaxID=948519 RepID=UPI00259D9FCF|nr:HlyD family efflux transporter periplasmic adaptor subunit [Aeromonas rivipollensis]MDM5093063.1 HlyD family efflux transporter periplasmic adaptor subunit [Aeromonas rivipollensis]
MTESLPPPQLLLALHALRDRALAARSLNALAFSMANDLYQLLPFHQALVFARHGQAQELLCVSGLARPSEDSPYLIWLGRMSRWLDAQISGHDPVWLARETLFLPEDLAEGWAEWWPEGVFCVPIQRDDGERLGMFCLLRESEPPTPLLPLLQGLWQTWAYCWHSLTHKPPLLGWRPSRRQLILLALAAGVMLLIPIRQSALAPAEVVSRTSLVISSPLAGVIEQMAVRPNQTVAAGAPLFRLDETTLRNRAEVLTQEVAVADAELLAASQRAFDNPQSRRELTLLTGRAQQKRAELAGVELQLSRSQVTAPRDGVAVFSDANDWLGKPVVTGERIMQLADPHQPAMRILLPVADAIALEPGADVTLFLSAYPLDPLRGKILETSYQAQPGADGVVAYRLLATIESPPSHARLGLHGTAKLYGERVLLGYYLLRRPLAALRAWSGL